MIKIGPVEPTMTVGIPLNNPKKHPVQEVARMVSTAPMRFCVLVLYTAPKVRVGAMTLMYIRSETAMVFWLKFVWHTTHTRSVEKFQMFTLSQAHAIEYLDRPYHFRKPVCTNRGPDFPDQALSPWLARFYDTTSSSTQVLGMSHVVISSHTIFVNVHLPMKTFPASGIISALDTSCFAMISVQNRSIEPK